MNLVYQVAVGSPSLLYDFCIESVNQYCKKYSIEHIVQREPILKIMPDISCTNRSKESYGKYGGFLPIYEKENAFSYLNQYQQIAIIDADIYIKPEAPNIFLELDNEAFGAVCEREMPVTDVYMNKIMAYSRAQYSNLKDVDWRWDNRGGEFFNMGLMLLGPKFKSYLNEKTPNEFIRKPEFKRFVDGLGNWKWSTDQTLLNWWIKKEQIPTKHLDWKFNALFKGIKDEKLSEAYFIHFFLKDLLPSKGEDVKQLMDVVNNLTTMEYKHK